MHAIAYIRVSTDEQHLGPDAQRAAIEKWSETEGIPVEKWFSDQGSGGLSIDKRPGLTEAISVLSPHTVLVVTRRDRLARDIYNAIVVERMIQQRGARIVSVAGEGSGEDDATAILIRRISDTFAEYERNVIKARTRAALAVKKSRGERVGGIPYGACLAEDGIHLLPDASELQTISRIHTFREDGISYRQIATLLNAEIVPCRGEKWHKTTIHRIVRGWRPIRLH